MEMKGQLRQKQFCVCWIRVLEFTINWRLFNQQPPSTQWRKLSHKTCSWSVKTDFDTGSFVWYLEISAGEVPVKWNVFVENFVVIRVLIHVDSGTLCICEPWDFVQILQIIVDGNLHSLTDEKMLLPKGHSFNPR